MPHVIMIGDCQRINTCCGVVELGDFNTFSGPLKEAEKVHKGWGDSHRRSRVRLFKDTKTIQQEIEEFIRSLMSNQPAAYYQAWFAAEAIFDDDDDETSATGDHEEYEAEVLRNAVKQFPNVVHLGEDINPNTSNKIDGYLWKPF